MHEYIITRPTHQAGPLVSAIRTLGLTAHAIPILNIQPIPVKQPLPEAEGSIFISPNAALFAHQQMSLHEWQQIVSHPVLAIGKSTRNKLQELGVRHICYPEPATSESLLMLKELQSLNGSTINLFCGQGGRRLIETELTSRGAQVKRIEVYQRKPVSNETIKQALTNLSETSVWVISSAEALDHLSNCLDKPVKLLVTSERLAQHARQQGHTIIAQSDSALTEDIIHCISSL